jgi:hypothetical protein
MSQPGDDLFLLIHSLNPSEKRYFKLFAQRQGNEKNKLYMKVFDLIDEQTEHYDEELLKKKLKSKADIKILPQVKIYLFDLVVKSMRVYRSDKTAATEVFDLIQDELFYTEKGLTDLRVKALKRAKEIAYKYDLSHMVVAILQRERIFAIKYSGGDPMNRINLIHEEEQQILHDLNVEAELGKIYYTLLALFIIDHALTNPAEAERVEEMKQHPLLQSIDGIRTYMGKILFYYCHKYIMRFTNDFVGMYENSKQLLATMEQYPQHYYNVTANYMDALSAALSAAHNVGRYDDFEDLLKKLKNLPHDKFKDEASIALKALQYRILYYMNTQKLDLCDELIEEYNHVKTKYAKLISDGSLLLDTYNICLFLFIKGDFNKSLEFCQDVLNMKTEARQNLQHAAMMMHLVLHFELGNTVYLDSAIRNTIRSMQNRNRYNHFEKTFIAHLKKLIKTPVLEQESIFEEMYHFYRDMFIQNNDKKLVLIEETLAWACSRYTRKPIAETMYIKHK